MKVSRRQASRGMQVTLPGGRKIRLRAAALPAQGAKIKSGRVTLPNGTSFSLPRGLALVGAPAPAPASTSKVRRAPSSAGSKTLRITMPGGKTKSVSLPRSGSAIKKMGITLPGGRKLRITLAR